MGSLLVVPLGGISVWLLTWVFAIIAGTAYLPVTASFSLLPLLAAAIWEPRSPAGRHLVAIKL